MTTPAANLLLSAVGMGSSEMEFTILILGLDNSC